MITPVVPVILAVVLVWSIVGFLWFKQLYFNDHGHNETKFEMVIGGPVIWAIIGGLAVYNFFVIKR